MRYLVFFLIIIVINFSCDTGNLEVVADITNQLEEVSSAELVDDSELIWVIQDAGNSNTVYGLRSDGTIEKTIKVTNAKNIDWEDLTSDGPNLYIGDFGDNSRNRERYTIYSIKNIAEAGEKVTAEIIDFNLPAKSKSLDFESFFIKDNWFYIVSKENEDFEVFKVENSPGRQTAKYLDKFKFKGSRNEITSADISEDGKKLVLLNHEKLWLIYDFAKDDFFNGKIEAIQFNHTSQKEGICFIKDDEVIITDENTGLGSNIYRFKLSVKK